MRSSYGEGKSQQKSYTDTSQCLEVQSDCPMHMHCFLSCTPSGAFPLRSLIPACMPYDGNREATSVTEEGENLTEAPTGLPIPLSKTGVIPGISTFLDTRMPTSNACS